ncbi:hypothetical protein RBB50_008007 [Rhinocladiella similis]
MQIAAFLSDLKSLSICPHEAAISLVVPGNAGQPDQTSTQPDAASSSARQPSSPGLGTDPRLARANELVSLHYDVKVKYLEAGPDPELEQAAATVDHIIHDLKR